MLFPSTSMNESPGQPQPQSSEQLPDLFLVIFIFNSQTGVSQQTPPLTGASILLAAAMMESNPKFLLNPISHNRLHK